MALASRFIRCHLPVVSGFRSLINSSRTGILNCILPTCQVSFILFSFISYFFLDIFCFLKLILAATGRQPWSKIVAMDDRVKPGDTYLNWLIKGRECSPDSVKSP